MRISEKQAMVMLRALEGSLRFLDGGDNTFGFDRETRRRVMEEVINQQSDEPKELEP